MPVFILDHGTPEASQLFASLDSFAQGYIEAMFFTSTGDDGELQHATVAELASETLARIKADCVTFQQRAATLLAEVYQCDYQPDQAGRDFWFTRNGHGVGFWSRDLGDVGVAGALDVLSDLASGFQTLDVYRGDDGLLYLA